VAEHIVLASRSPRRVQLLAELGIEPVVDPADVDEAPRQNEDPVAYVRRVAADKARRVAQRHSGATVIAADTTVDVDGRILGQPLDIDDARMMLRTLSARTHRVHTAVVVIDGQGERADVSRSARQVPMPCRARARYWLSGSRGQCRMWSVYPSPAPPGSLACRLWATPAVSTRLLRLLRVAQSLYP